MSETLEALIPKLAHQRILILGDVILDEYVTGKAERLSREAPIPVLELTSRAYIPGGAANPASNIVALGSRALQVGIVGEDDAAEHLRLALAHHGIDTSGLITSADKPTTLKTRILAQMGLRFPQQIARVDTVSRSPIKAAIEAQLIAVLEAEAPKSQAILVSDYNNGLLTASFVEKVRRLAQVKKIPLFVDAQSGLDKYRGFDLVKCNADDASTYLQRTLSSNADFAGAAQELSVRLQVKQGVVITRGAEGASLAESNGHISHCPSPKVRNVYDTVGAGDTTIAVLTLARVGGASLVDAVTLANYASGIVIQHVGNYAPSPDELLRAIQA